MSADSFDPRSPSVKRTPLHSTQDSPARDIAAVEKIALEDAVHAVVEKETTESIKSTHVDVIVVEESDAVSSVARKSVTEVFNSPTELSPASASVSNAIYGATYSPSLARRKGKEFSPLRKSYSAPADENAQAAPSPGKAKLVQQEARTPLSPLSQNTRFVSTAVHPIKFRMDPGILG